jgi:23S rRNA (uracil1939-C5)-methyltransferase
VKVSGTEVWSEAHRFHAALEARGEAATIWWLPEAGAPRVVAGASDTYPATVFEQVHPALGDRIRAYAVEQLGELPGRHVWDLYAGIGETTQALLAGGAAVESVEVDRRAVEVGGQTVGRTDGPMRGRVRRLVGRAEELVQGMAKPDLVITNPPRVGMDRLVVDAIRAASPRRLVYISCDPATLARDLARVTQPSVRPPVHLSLLRAFDLFPQTAHVETVAVVEAA